MGLNQPKKSLLWQQLTDLMCLILHFFARDVLIEDVMLDLPDRKDRFAILKIHARKKPLAEGM
jgi:hypothetical protein